MIIASRPGQTAHGSRYLVNVIHTILQQGALAAIACVRFERVGTCLAEHAAFESHAIIATGCKHTTIQQVRSIPVPGRLGLFLERRHFPGR